MDSPVEYLEKSWGDDANIQGWKGPGWYFWDETWAFCHGPFGSESQASLALQAYAEELARNTE